MVPISSHACRRLVSHAGLYLMHACLVVCMRACMLGCMRGSRLLEGALHRSRSVISGWRPFEALRGAMAGAMDKYDPDNVFAKILRNEVPAFRIFETDDVVAILDAFPVTPGHCLLIPKEPVRDFSELSAAGAARALRYVPVLVQLVKAATGATGANIVMNCGEDAGQVVFHAHLHVIPRFPGDGVLKFPRNAPLKGGEEMLAKMKAKLPEQVFPTD